MTEREKEKGKLDEGAAKLDEGARKLDAGAGMLHEGAQALHEVAVQMKGDGSQPLGGRGSELASSEAGATVLRVTRAQADQLRRSVRDSGARAVVLLKRHPLTALTTLGVAVAFIKAPFAVGLLAGVAGAAFLVNEPGMRTRQTLVSKSRLALARARDAWQARRKALPQPATS